MELWIMKFLTFIKCLNPDGLISWSVENEKSKEILGEIRFYRKWKKWVFSPLPNSFYSKGRITEIKEFMDSMKLWMV